jgi:hypothetical protein
LVLKLAEGLVGDALILHGAQNHTPQISPAGVRHEKGDRALEFHPRFEVLVSEIRAPKPGPIHSGEKATPPFAIPCNGAAVILLLRLRALFAFPSATAGTMVGI